MDAKYKNSPAGKWVDAASKGPIEQPKAKGDTFEATVESGEYVRVLRDNIPTTTNIDFYTFPEFEALCKWGMEVLTEKPWRPDRMVQGECEWVSMKEYDDKITNLSRLLDNARDQNDTLEANLLNKDALNRDLLEKVAELRATIRVKDKATRDRIAKLGEQRRRIDELKATNTITSVVPVCPKCQKEIPTRMDGTPWCNGCDIEWHVNGTRTKIATLQECNHRQTETIDELKKELDELSTWWSNKVTDLADQVLKAEKLLKDARMEI